MRKRRDLLWVAGICIFLLGVLSVLWVVLGAEEPSVVGRASWYGGGEKLNRLTANGEVFDPTLLTAASWQYPFGTRLRVVNVKTGKAVIVRVNDRGPARRLKRIIDLSREAFRRIAPLRQGVVEVRVEVRAEKP